MGVRVQPRAVRQQVPLQTLRPKETGSAHSPSLSAGQEAAQKPRQSRPAQGNTGRQTLEKGSWLSEGLEQSCLLAEPSHDQRGGEAAYLRHGVELHHGGGERLRIRAQRRDEPQHGPVEGAVDLRQRGGPRVIHVHHRHVTQESVQRQRAQSPGEERCPSAAPVWAGPQAAP